MGAIERIYQFIDYKGVSVKEFSDNIGVSNGYLAKQKANSANLGSHIVEKIVVFYPDISVEWLITGRGRMLKSDISNFSGNNNVIGGTNGGVLIHGNKTDGGEINVNNSRKNNKEIKKSQNECEKCFEKDKLIQELKLQIREKDLQIKHQAVTITSLIEKIK